jgi:hypothetical protein
VNPVADGGPVQTAGECSHVRSLHARKIEEYLLVHPFAVMGSGKGEFERFRKRLAELECSLEE